MIMNVNVGRMMVALLLAATMAACASTPASERSERGGRAVLTTVEIQGASYADAFSVVRALRPEWLRSTPNSFRSSEQIQVYLDGNRLGGVEQLQQISTGSIKSMQFLTGLEAANRWGLNHGAGAIVVSTR
jgi:hypothetical protein